MTISVPAVQWPSEFREKGPDKDPGILLAGEAQVAGVAFAIAALRIRKGGHGPDFRDDIPEEDYESSLENLMESVEDLVGSIRPATILINGARYVLWMVPHPGG